MDLNASTADPHNGFGLTFSERDESMHGWKVINTSLHTHTHTINTTNLKGACAQSPLHALLLTAAHANANAGL